MSEPKEPQEFQEEQKQNQETLELSEPQETPLEKDKMLELQEQVTEFREKYLRGLADSENQRKRLQKEKQELIQYALQGVMMDFLSPIDHLENALKFADQATPEIKHWAVGFQMILEQFKDVLTNNKVIRFSAIGQQFDPHCHEAVEMITTNDSPPGTVLEESQCGYKMGDKTIRPARVKVAKCPPIEAEEDASVEKIDLEQ